MLSACHINAQLVENEWASESVVMRDSIFHLILKRDVTSVAQLNHLVKRLPAICHHAKKYLAQPIP
jgi:hypothetical protein